MAGVKAFFNNRAHVLFAVIFSATLIVVNIIRILRVPITFDEPCYDPTETYWQLMMNGWGHANNHVLHSILRKFFVEHFGYNTLSMRLDSLIALTIFLIFGWLICRLLFRTRLWQLGSFIFLNITSPYLFEFWGLSRGYGLALMFMMTSIYHFTCYVKGQNILFLFISFATAGLAVYSNFSYLNYYASLAGTLLMLNILFFREQQKLKIIKEVFIFALVTGAFALLIYEPLKNTLSNGEQSFLGSNGFIGDTVRSLVSAGFMLPNGDTITTLITWTAIVITCLCGGYWLLNCIKKRLPDTSGRISVKYGISLFLLLFIPAISLIMQHALLDINYLIDRTALFFIVLFILLLLYTLCDISNLLPKISNGIFLLLLTLVCYNFLSKITLNSTRQWWFNRDDVVALDRVVKRSQNKGHKIKLCVSWTFHPTMNYDIEQYYKGVFDTLKVYPPTNKKDTSYDYYYLNSDEKIDSLLPFYHKDTILIGGATILWEKN